jgi:predicted aldo/keto reductase-like oxidoreductase
MKKEPKGCTRRDFFKATGAAGVGALLSPVAAGAAIGDKGADRLLASTEAKVPTRPFGKTGMDVSILSLGGMFDINANQLMLKQALKWGATYWDTADCYGKGASEEGFGKYFAKYPRDREKVFLVTKSDARDPDGMSKLLDRSLKRMNTAYIDLYFVHGVRDMDELNDATRRWAEKAKEQKKIRLFGFSTHKNMEKLLSRASKLGYIDGIMMTYNFRNMHTPKMKAAVEACVKAGIGLTAMKTQARRSWKSLNKANKLGEQMMESFIAKGLTQEQAKLKAVWTNPHIAAICSQMPNMTILKANVAAAVDHTPLTSKEMHLFEQYALATADQYCTGCGHICESAVVGKLPISDIMRYHMYGLSYGHLDWARTHFRQLPSRVRRQLPEADFRGAEHRCPQNLPIAKLMRQAVKEFG